MPVIVRDLDDDAATIIMVDSNLQRESLLPSERAFAYKMKLEAMKHQGERVDLTSSQVGTKYKKRKTKKCYGNSIGSFICFFNQSFRFDWSFIDANRKEESDLRTLFVLSDICTADAYFLHLPQFWKKV